MANTLRESTAPSGENTTESAGSGPIPALGFGPHHSTPADVICQEFSHLKLPIREPMISCIASAVDMAYESHSETDGATISLVHGNMAGEKVFAVSIYPGRTVELGTPPTWRELYAFALENADLLLKPRHALGSWLDDDWTHKHVLDVVVLFSDRDEALDHGARCDQRSIYSLEVGQVIAVPRSTHEPVATTVGVGDD
jgi:hypothetical protein